MLFSLLFSSLLWAQTIPWQDSDFGCFDRNTALRYEDDFNIDVRSFGGFELCNSKVDTKKLFNDLAIIEHGSFSQALTNVYIKGFVPADNYYRWMKSQTYGVRRGNDMPTATAYNRGGKFTMQDGWADSSTLGRVGTVIHEARHTAGYYHINCKQGPYAGVVMAGCDPDYNYGGSHAVEMEYYARVSVQGTNFHPVYKTMARLMAVARSNAFFNSPVVQKKEALLALSATQARADLIVDGKLFPREAPGIQGTLKRTSYGAAVFDGRNALSIELYGAKPIGVPIVDTYSYYKLISKSSQPKVFDFEEFDIGPKRYVTMMPNRNSLQVYDFPRGQWSRPTSLNFEVAMTATRLENGQSGFFLIDKAASIYPVNVQNASIGSPLQFKWNPNVVSVAALNQRLYVLMRDGIIYERSAARGYKAQGQNRDRFRGLVNIPIYNGFEVEP